MSERSERIIKRVVSVRSERIIKHVVSVRSTEVVIRTPPKAVGR
jgi:hypothetical protein